MNKRYAVLISAGLAHEDGYDEFWNDLVLMWRALRNTFIESLHFDDENIIILYGNGEDFCQAQGNYRLDSKNRRKNYDLFTDRSRKCFVDYPATIDNLKKVFGVFTNNSSIDESDEIFIWTFGHGDYMDGMSYLCFSADINNENYYMPASLFADIIKDIKCSSRVTCMQQCNSGGFIKEIQNSCPDKNNTILTSCSEFDFAVEADYSEELENGANIGHGEFDYHFASALQGHTPQNADVRNLIEKYALDYTRNCGGPVASASQLTWDYSILYSSIYTYIKQNSRADTAQYFSGGIQYGARESNELLSALWTYGDGTTGDIRLKFTFDFSELFKKEGQKEIQMYLLDSQMRPTLLHKFNCNEELTYDLGSISCCRDFTFTRDHFETDGNSAYYYMNGVITADFFRRIIYFDGFVNYSLNKYCKIQSDSEGKTSVKMLKTVKGKKSIPEGNYFKMDSIKGLRCAFTLFSWI